MTEPIASAAYERLFPSRNQSIEFCRRAIAKGTAEAHGAAVSLNDGIDWLADCGRGRAFIYHLNAWDPIDDFFIAYDESGQDDYLANILTVTANWCRTFNTFDVQPLLDRRQLDEDLIWYDMGCGMRVYRLAYIIDVLHRGGGGWLQATERQRLLAMYAASLGLHQRFLANERNFRTNNHGMYQAFGQLAAGARLIRYKMPGAPEMHDQGRQRLIRLLDLQFTEEGIHKEHSPFYHEAVCRILQQALAAGLLSDSQLKMRVERMVENLEWFITPDNRLANFGDTDSEPPAQNYGRWKAHHGDAGTHLGVFPKSGYWIVRRYGQSGESYLSVASAFHSRSHKHADDCTMIWYERGRRILLDAGRFNYSGRVREGEPLWDDGYWYSDPGRVYVERTRAHNTIEVNDRNQPRKRVKPYGSGLVAWRTLQLAGKEDSEPAVYVCDCEARSLRSIRYLHVVPERHPVRHFRILAYLPGLWLVCIDVLNQARPFAAKQWFNLDPRFQLQDSRVAELRCIDESSGDLFHIASMAGEMTVVEQGRGKDGPGDGIYPGLLGWHSDRANQLRPNLAVAFGSAELSKSWHFATLLCLDPVSVDRSYTRFNATGRRGHFRWTVAGTTYTMSYMREDTSGAEVTISARRPWFAWTQ